MNSFARSVRLELTRALGSPPFIIAVSIATLGAIGIALAEGLGALSYLDQLAESMGSSWVAPFAKGAFTLWLPMVSNAQLPGLFFMLLPLLCATAYGWSLRSDLDSGYAASIVTRAGSTPYYVAKSCAAFLCGGLVAAISLVANLATLFCVVPAYAPSALDVVYTGIGPRVFASALFYNHPLGYIALRVALDFALGGLWSCATLTVSQFLHSRLAILTVPLIATITLQSIWTTLASLQATLLGVDQTWSSITIIDHLRSRGDSLYYEGWAVATDFAFLLAVSIAGVLAYRRRELR